MGGNSIFFESINRELFKRVHTIRVYVQIKFQEKKARKISKLARAALNSRSSSENITLLAYSFLRNLFQQISLGL